MNQASYSKSPDVIAQPIGGETVLLDLNSEVYFGLDETGSRIWQLLDTCTDVTDIVSNMAEEYDVNVTRLTEDVNALLVSLESKGLIART